MWLAFLWSDGIDHEDSYPHPSCHHSPPQAGWEDHWSCGSSCSQSSEGLSKPPTQNTRIETYPTKDPRRQCSPSVARQLPQSGASVGRDVGLNHSHQGIHNSELTFGQVLHFKHEAINNFCLWCPFSFPCFFSIYFYFCNCLDCVYAACTQVGQVIHWILFFTFLLFQVFYMSREISFFGIVCTSESNSNTFLWDISIKQIRQIFKEKIQSFVIVNKNKIINKICTLDRSIMWDVQWLIHCSFK